MRKRFGGGGWSNFRHTKLPNLNYTHYSQNYTPDLSAVMEIFHFPGPIQQLLTTCNNLKLITFHFKRHMWLQTTIMGSTTTE